ncbi:MAG TPA: FecR domain-containing protein, partial [Pyrinomonadaceae bacterium]|nr:FecR domain-containing protein [Pyrinomonadaceae bacterium]
MKTRITAICIAAIVSALGAQASFAQDKTIAAAAGDKYVISARAGGVNYTEGTVGIVRKRGTSGRLFKGDTIEIGDRVSTGADGRAEILLNPGSYLRIGGESAFQFGSTALDDLLIKLDRGTSILEVFAGNEFVVTLKSPKATFKLIQSGVYRFDVAA